MKAKLNERSSREMNRMEFEISTGYIKLDSFLKCVNAVGSGGEAKVIIAEGEVSVNGQTEPRRGRKLYPGDQVTLRGDDFMVKAAP
jgi:ribosome-associated protein